MAKFIKKRIKRAVKPLYRHLSSNSSILLYHRIAEPKKDPQMLSVSPSVFEEQISMIARKFRPVRLAEMAERINSRKKLLPRSVAVTFDDGYLDNLEDAVPILEQYRVPATIFIATGCLKEAFFWWDFIASLVLFSVHKYPMQVSFGAKTFSWDLTNQSIENDDWVVEEKSGSIRSLAYDVLMKEIKPLSKIDRDRVLMQLCDSAGVIFSDIKKDCPPLMSEKEVLDLVSSKFIDIGGHTVNHLQLSCFSYREQLDEIKHGCFWLEQVTKMKVNLFAYPFGSKADYNLDSINAVEQLGISASLANWSYRLDRDADINQLPRLLCRNFSSDALFNKMTDGLSSVN